MPARLTAYLHDEAATDRLLREDDVCRIGRGDDCGFRLEHPSISRAHAELSADGGDWRLVDLGSKNGSFRDGQRIDDVRIDGAAWLRFGDIYCEFTPLSDEDCLRIERERGARRTQSLSLSRRVSSRADGSDLLHDTLKAVLELAQCRRGFLLLREDGDFRVHASVALNPTRMNTRAFAGSVAAVQRALAERRAVVANDVAAEPWLAQRPSVIAGGLSALVCLPLVDGERVFGAIYADRSSAGAPITSLDLELLKAFAQRASLWISARRLEQELGPAPEGFPRWQAIAAAHRRSAV